MSSRDRIFTVRGVTANLKRLTELFGEGLSYQRVHARMHKHDWTVEEALGLAPRPIPRPPKHRLLAPLIDGPRLAPADENFLNACFEPLGAEEFLRLEGVPMNEHPLPDTPERWAAVDDLFDRSEWPSEKLRG